MAVLSQTGGTNGGSYAKYFTGRLTVTEGDYDISTNKSPCYYKLELISGSSGRFSDYGANYSVSIDGAVRNSGSGTYSLMSANTSLTICEGTVWIEHNADGSKKNMAISATLDFASGTYSPGDFNLSGTMDLVTIPRASSITAVDANIESATTININRASSGFRHTITYSFQGLTGTIATKTSDTSVGWSIPSSFYAKIPNSKTGTVTLTCYTYNGDTHIGTKTTTFTITASEAKCKPTVSATLIDANSATVALSGNNAKLIKYKSTAKITPTATAKNSATVSKITVNGYTLNGSYISFENVQSETFTVVVTDSRGYTNTVELKPIIIQYIPLSVSAKFERLTQTSSQVKVTYSGNYYNGSFGSTSNTLTLVWKWREQGQTEWQNGGTLTATINQNTFSGQTTLSTSQQFDYREAYEFILYVTDKLGTIPAQDTVKIGETYFDYGVDANGNNYVNFNANLYKNNIKIPTETVLYNNSTGTTGNVTLSETAANFDYLEIFLIRDSWEYSVKVYSPNGKTVIATTAQYYSSDNVMYLYTKKMSISAKNITIEYNKGQAIGANPFDDNAHKIKRVVGYK